jgi:hypothetical protein
VLVGLRERHGPGRALGHAGLLVETQEERSGLASDTPQPPPDLPPASLGEVPAPALDSPPRPKRPWRKPQIVMPGPVQSAKLAVRQNQRPELAPPPGGVFVRVQEDSSHDRIAPHASRRPVRRVERLRFNLSRLCRQGATY